VKRREFISLVGGAAAARPVGAWAQQRLRRVGLLMNAGADDQDQQASIAAFLQSLLNHNA
jgi:hypothetical protein